MSQLRNVHLFNCDRTYKLDAVEGLLNGMKAKLGFESVEKHPFSLSQMSAMSTKIIPELKMDLAFLSSMHTNLASRSTKTTLALVTRRSTELCWMKRVGRRKYFYWVDFLYFTMFRDCTFNDILQHFCTR
ncbi:hypothetical protein OS493_010527 [Desmophyllum pertusum]|uniref:Uncharacterized protein n=1 Tax=Desmophyllum pertusum TaxID=174260 RepID=A0A9X0A3S9_9CNID|nr:hypothetical protein OS493_010527 [Desmophyllum pertusum]